MDNIEALDRTYRLRVAAIEQLQRATNKLKTLSSLERLISSTNEDADKEYIGRALTVLEANP